MAHRVGPAGHVTGIDIDAGLGAQAQAMLHEAGHRQCRVYAYGLTADEQIPGAPLDVVFARLGCDIHTGARLPDLFAQAGIDAPDGTDVAGRLEPLARAVTMVEAVVGSLMPVAVARGITTGEQAEATLAALREDAIRHAARPTLWPLLIGAWKRRSPSDG